MAKHRNVFTHPKPGGGWGNSVGGHERPVVHRTKEVAVEVGRSIARQEKSEHTITRKDGVITEKNSYGGDPFPPKG